MESGHLSWTPPHRNEEFWRENATKLTEQNDKLLKILARLLATSKNPIVLAVGCHDVGQLVKQVPQAITSNPFEDRVDLLGKFNLLGQRLGLWS